VTTATHSISPKTAALLATARESLRRDDVVAAIRSALKDRSGKSWSITGGRGTAYGWLKIASPKARAADKWGSMTAEECAELAALLGLGRVNAGGESVPAGHDYYRQYLDLAERGETAIHARPYWD
jgi:hypothetical protein